jgi:thiamine kinase-like enzyme
MGMTPGDVLARIEGWAGARVTVLDGGLSNHTWLVELDDRSAVLKIDDQPRREPYNTRRREAEIQSRAFEAGLANRVLYADQTVYLTEFVEGTVWSPACLHDSGKLGQLAIALRKLHSLPLTGRVFDAAGAARDYARHLDDADERRAGECLRLIEAAPRPGKLCFCHNDLVAENIISMPEVRFLDWEYACDNDPLFDLATVAAHHDLSAEQRTVLLDAYFDGDGSRWQEPLARQAELYEALLYLWQQSRSR